MNKVICEELSLPKPKLQELRDGSLLTFDNKEHVYMKTENRTVTGDIGILMLKTGAIYNLPPHTVVVLITQKVTIEPGR